MKILFGGVGWLVGWLVSIYFYRRIRDKHQGFPEAILSMVLMGVSAWVMRFTIGIWFSVVIGVITAFTWWVARTKPG